MQGALEEITKKVSSWEGVSALPHRFGGTEFRIGRCELGHVHVDSFADIVLPMDVRNKVVGEERAAGDIPLQKGWRCRASRRIVQNIV